MECPNYEVVWSRTDPLLIQSGSNLGQGTTQPYTMGDQPALFNPNETKKHANDNRQMGRRSALAYVKFLQKNNNTILGVERV